MARRFWALVPLLALALLGGNNPPAGAAPAVQPVTIFQTTTRTLQLPATLSTRWTQVARIGYGTTAPLLGTSSGGDEGGIRWGPSYGTQLPDGTWWYADAAKNRLAHYSDSGRYLGAVPIPPKFLAQGIHFQWQNPQALADGTVVLTSTTIDSPGLLLLSPSRTLRRVPLAQFVGVVISDGHRLYGFDQDLRKVKVAPKIGTITPVTRFTGQSGDAFNLSTGTGYLKVSRPGVRIRINLAAAGFPGKTVSPIVEAAMGKDGRLWILVTGIVEVNPEQVELVVGLLNITRDGDVSSTARVRDPSSESDPGDGHHLGIRHGGSRPWLMFIDNDAVRVYRRK